MKKNIFAIVALPILSLGTVKVLAQGIAVNTSGSAADASAIFDASSTSQGMLIPRMNNSQMTSIASPAPGLLLYCTDCSPIGFYYYNGSTWASLSGSVTGSAGGDLAGTYPNPTIASTAGTGSNIVTAINASSSVVNAANLGTGSSITTKFLRGDNTWQTVSGGSGSTYALGGVEYFTQNKSSYFSSITTDNSGSTFAVGDVGFPIPKTGTLTAIAVSGMCTATYISGSTNIVTFTIYQNGASSGTTGSLTFPNSASVNQRFSNVTTTSLAVTAGDILAINISQSNFTNGAIGKTSVVLYFQ